MRRPYKEEAGTISMGRKYIALDIRSSLRHKGNSWRCGECGGFCSHTKKRGDLGQLAPRKKLLNRPLGFSKDFWKPRAVWRGAFSVFREIREKNR